MRLAAATELLALYSIPTELLPFFHRHPSPIPEPILSQLLCSCIPFSTAASLVDSVVDALFRTLDHRDSARQSTISVLLQHATRPADPLDWTAAYASDPDTCFIIKLLSTNASWDQSSLNKVSSAYRPFLRDNRMCMMNGKLVAMQPVSNRSQVLALIVAPLSLRRHLFSAYHASPVTGHMKEFKTLHRLRLRFLWPKMRSDIVAWVRMCPHCVLTDKQTRENKELVFSWPVTSPFFILHVDLWAPGSITDYRGNTYLLAGMCDLTGFVVQSAVTAITSHDLARIFYQEFLLKFGMCSMVVVDAGSNFLAVFEAMCDVLKIRFHAAAKGNHKAVSVERYFRFVNKAVTIAINDRDDPSVWVPAAMTAGYAWNSAPIDGTDILRSVAAVGRPFLFPIDISLSLPPQLCSDNAAAVAQYLTFISEHASFSQTILRFLVEDRRLAHAERANESRNPFVYDVGDRVMATVQVQSEASRGKVAKLSYQRRGPFEIISRLGHGAYELRSLSRPNAAPLKFHSSSISPLPPGLLPCDPIDTSDLRYLNQDSTPSANPLRSLDIQLYNDVWFDDKPASHPAPFDFSASLHTIPPFASSPFPSLTELDDSLGPSSPAKPATTTPIVSVTLDTTNDSPCDPFASPPVSVPPHSASLLYSSILASTDRMFFISYLPEGTLRPRWYLVAANLESSLADPASADCRTSGNFCVDFYCRHPDDRSSSDTCARWWREWHRYSTDPTDGTLIFGDQVLFRPGHKPPSDRYISWSDVVPLLNPLVALVGPFNLATSSPFSSLIRPSARQWVPLSMWQQLCSLCASRGILLPSVSPQPVLRSRWTKTKKRKRLS